MRLWAKRWMFRYFPIQIINASIFLFNMTQILDKFIWLQKSRLQESFQTILNILYRNQCCPFPELFAKMLWFLRKFKAKFHSEEILCMKIRYGFNSFLPLEKKFKRAELKRLPIKKFTNPIFEYRNRRNNKKNMIRFKRLNGKA